jgi:hypothetical protein
MCQVLTDAAINAWLSQLSQIISFYFVKKVKSPVPLHPFCQGFRESAGVAIIQNARAFFVLAAYPRHAFLAVDLQRCILPLFTFSSSAKMLCNAVEI